MSPGDDAEVERLLRLAGTRPGAPAGVEDRVHAAVLARWRSEVAARRRRRRIVWASGLAAAAAVLVVIAPALRRSSPERTDVASSIATVTRVAGSPRTTPVLPAVAPGILLPEEVQVETGPDDRLALLLSDGTSLRVDRETHLRLLAGPVVDLDRGAVYVETAESGRGAGGLRIRTSLGVVRDIGTRFQVRLADDVLKITVRSGSARLEQSGASHEAMTGTQLVADNHGEVTSRSVPAHDPEWEWTLAVAPELEIEGRTLGEFLDWSSRETGLRVRFAETSMEPGARATVLHGSIRGMNPDEALGAVLPTCGLGHDVEGDALVIRRAAGGPAS